MPRTLNALVVDDCPVSRKTIAQALSATGLAAFDFTEAVDGVDALTKYNAESTDIVFVDMNMPRMDGMEFLRQLNAAPVRRAPAVMITAESNGERLAEAMNQCQVDAILLKPVNAERLRAGLRTLIKAIPDRAAGWTVPHGDCAVQAVQETLAKACGLNLVPEPRASQTDPGGSDGEEAPGPFGEGKAVVFGMTTLVGELQWSVSLGFHRETAERVASRFGGYTISFDDPDLGDAIAEITNMVAGRLKALLHQRALRVEHSLPTVLRAENLRFLIHRGRRTTKDRVDFASEAGRLWISATSGLISGLVL